MKHSEDDPPFVFAHIGKTCSICARATVPQHEIEDEAAQQLGGVWLAIDKSKHGLGLATPNPCDHSNKRHHWFLLTVDMARKMGIKPQ